MVNVVIMTVTYEIPKKLPRAENGYFASNNNNNNLTIIQVATLPRRVASRAPNFRLVYDPRLDPRVDPRLDPRLDPRVDP